VHPADNRYLLAETDEVARLKAVTSPSNPPTTAGGGVLVINADDWGRDRNTTEKILICAKLQRVSAVSAMVFMEDSERSAAVAREHGIDAGLHLNFTTPFSAAGTSARLIEHQQRLCRYLRSHRYAQAVFHPGLTRSFQYVVEVQSEEFTRLYGAPPQRIDGHHHMHLCANVVVGRLLPYGIITRRNFTMRAGETSLFNRFYRRMVDRQLARRHLLTDFFFSLAPVAPPSRLRQIFSLARHWTTELETHLINSDEYNFLKNDEVLRWTRGLSIAPRYEIARKIAA
jgi:chitin disaccharide deacetylase